MAEDTIVVMFERSDDGWIAHYGPLVTGGFTYTTQQIEVTRGGILGAVDHGRQFMPGPRTLSVKGELGDVYSDTAKTLPWLLRHLSTRRQFKGK